MYDELDNPEKADAWKYALAALLVLAIILGLAIGLGVGLSSSSSQPTPLPTCSNDTQILVLTRTDVTRENTGENPIVARCYGGGPWEPVSDQDFPPLEIECSSDSDCSVMTPGTYVTSAIDVPPELLDQTTQETVARFLSQATFGASLTDIQNLAASFNKKRAAPNFLSWIKAQMALPPTLLRAYYRQRVNPRQDVSNAVGSIFQPCEVGSRYHRFAFNVDDESKTLVVSATEVPNMFTLRIDGILRTETNNFLNQTFPASNYTFPMSLIICNVPERVGGFISLSFPTNTSCKTVWGTANPPISFTTPDNTITRQLTTAQATLTPIPGVLDAFIMTSVSTTCNLNIRNAFIGYNGAYLRFDPRLKFLLNSLETPASTPAEGSCPTVAATFLNENSCVKQASCAPVQFSAAPLTLNQANLRTWYTANNKFVYYIQGLRLEAPYAVSPCTKSTRSRWLRMGPGACPAPTALDALTLLTIQTALANSTDANPNVRDIILSGTNCTVSPQSIGAQIFAAGECFRHVHPDHLTVRDMSQWVIYHDGNVNFPPSDNPIERWAKQGLVSLSFPPSHPMQRWSDKNKFFPLVGRWGDVISFSDLPTALQTKEQASAVGALIVGSDQGFKVCGSPGEAANNPLLGNRYQLPDPNSISDLKARQLDWNYDWSSGKNNIWLNVVLTANDQLRQRVAWALAQIFTISEIGIERGSDNEPWVTYYDIFVRNAFGNYKNILKEVSYSPMMGTYLTYLYNTGFAYKNTYPDENYAREIMQLFSIGLWQLNDDYSQKLDDNGNPIPTYTNDDILDFARLWTGFDFRAGRGNVEQAGGPGSSNIMDPMILHPGWRDKFPKAKLDKGFLGDAYPLCDDLPPKHWLTTGATFELTGNTSVEGPMMDAIDPKNVGLWGRFEAKSTGALYQKLCQPDGSGACGFPISVTLDSNLVCDGMECNAQRVTSVKVVDKVMNKTRYYTYHSVPCVRLSFWEGQGQIVGLGNSRQCGNPKHKVAFPVCCHKNYYNWGIDQNDTYLSATPLCSFANEAMDYETAKERCTANDWPMCNITYTGWTSWGRTCVDAAHMWLNQTCSVQVEVLTSGQIGIADPSITDAAFKLLKQGSGNVFRVRWVDGKYPDPENCAAYGCTTNSSSDTCLCDITVTNSVVFTEPVQLQDGPKVDLVLPSPQEVREKLSIGAADPASFPSGTYTKCASTVCASRKDVTVWLKSGSSTWDETTIFQISSVHVGGKDLFLMNYESIVKAGTTSYFRNPPHFMPLAGEQGYTWAQQTNENLYVGSSEQEIESALDHFFHHNNTAPFVCFRLIQRIVTSNPSPRYMKACVDAFRTGAYDGQTFSGVYGDLGAAVAAVLLDKEARSDMLQADPNFGAIREPLLKVVHVLRALQFSSYTGKEVTLPNLAGRIGMEVFQQSSVFGFYLPEHRPSGPISDAGLVGPEVQIGTSPFVVGYLNGLASLIDNGLTSCDGGLGWSPGRNCRNATTKQQTSDGILAYSPANGSTPEQIVNELDLLLTGGRLNPTVKNLILEDYYEFFALKGPAAALARVEKLIIATSEFHSTGGNLLSNKTRTQSTDSKSQGRPYKAVVVMFMNGGCDSYNMLVPLAQCKSKNLYAEYQAVRAEASLNVTDLLPIQVPAGTQPCDQFGLHSSMPGVQSLYNAKDALFVANIGALVEPLTKADYKGTSGKPKKFPPSLFAHNVMQRSMHNLDPANLAAKGVLGRAVHALEEQANYKSDLYSLIGTIKILEGPQEPDYVDPYGGVTRFNQFAAFNATFGNITEYESESIFAETFARILTSSLSKTESLGAKLTNITLATTFQTDYVSRQLMQVAKLIKLRDDLKTERAVFVTQNYGYDTHSTFDLSKQFGWIDTGLSSFAAEMKAQGIWDDVVFVTVSEFGRTLTPNNGGTDHAWGGNHFLAGGGLKGGKILGTYPDDLTDDGELNIGRGRLLPSTSWEAVWNGVVRWFGVDDAHLPYVLPNADNFPGQLFSQSDLFE